MTAQLILASRSQARIKMLSEACIDHQVVPADIDEDAIIKQADSSSLRDVAHKLACAKAEKISQMHKGSLVLGADQVLIHNQSIIQKAENKKDSIAKLKMLSGSMHELVSSAAIFKDSKLLWSSTDYARMTMYAFNDQDLSDYADKAQNALTQSVGGYFLEGVGINLFEKIDGDFFTILGLPLRPLLSYLYQRQGIRGF